MDFSAHLPRFVRSTFIHEISMEEICGVRPQSRISKYFKRPNLLSASITDFTEPRHEECR